MKTGLGENGGLPLSPEAASFLWESRLQARGPGWGPVPARPLLRWPDGAPRWLSASCRRVHPGERVWRPKHRPPGALGTCGLPVPVPRSTAASWLLQGPRLLQGPWDALKMSLVLAPSRLCTEPRPAQGAEPPGARSLVPARPQPPVCTRLPACCPRRQRPAERISNPRSSRASDKAERTPSGSLGAGADPGRPQAAGVSGLVRPGTTRNHSPEAPPTLSLRPGS